MKKAFKVLSVLTAFVVTIVSFPKIGITPRANVGNDLTTYIFEFDGEDQYNFYQETDSGTGYGPAFTNNYEEGVTPSGKSTFTASVAPDKRHSSAESILGTDAANKVASVTAPVMRGDTALANGDLGDFVSPDSRIFSDTTYLTSGSFDLCLGRAARYTPIFVFGQDKEKAIFSELV